MSLEALTNSRELEKEKIVKTAEKIKDAIEKENYRMVQKYKENLKSLLEKWESFHLQIATKMSVSINDATLKAAHQEVLEIAEKAEEEADNYYNGLKQKKKEEKQAEKERVAALTRVEQEKKAEADREARKPILKDFFTTEMREINKIVTDYSLRIDNKKAVWIPETQALVSELQYIEKRYDKAVQAYNQFMMISTDAEEIAKLRDLKNAEERKYRQDFLKLNSFANKLSSNPQAPEKVNFTLPTRQYLPNISGEENLR